VRVVIGEDSALFREGVAALLESTGHDVVGRTGDARELPALVRSTSPDLAIVDIRMPPDLTDDGARAAIEIRNAWPTLPILLLSAHVETRHSVALVSQGAFGYLLKDRVLDVDDFLATVERVAAGGSALDPEVVARLLTARTASALDTLTPREHDVLELMAEGRTNVGIGHRLFLTERTVETHVSNILGKLGLTTDEHGHRRVLAVLAYLRSRAEGGPTAG
jgi:DNA-binding NarL/FixJ family response regulator